MSVTTIKHLTKIFPINKDSLKPNDREEKPGVIVKEFCLNTSAHGFAGIARSRNLFSCLFWTIPTLGFLSVMIFFIVKAIMNYREYPTQTSVDIVNQWPLAFPAVTICNYSPLRYDTFKEPFLNYTNATEISDETAMYIDQFIFNSALENNYSNIYFFPLTSLLISCSYNDLPCNSTNFATFSVRDYGACHTFNARLKSIPNGGIRYNSDNGGTGILKLEMYIHRHQYVPYVRKAAGMIAMIHENDRIPNLVNSAMFLSPGLHHRWNYRQKAFSFLSAPFTTCTNKIPEAMRILFDQYQTIDYRYSTNICFDICIQTLIYDRCGCVSPILWNIRSIVLPGSQTVINAEICPIRDPCWFQTAQEFTGNLSIWNIYCADCQDECNYAEFVIQPTTLPVIFDYDIDRIKSFVERSNIALPDNWSSVASIEIPKSYVSLEILTESSRVETYTQQATIGLVDLISNIGGQTGLWIGISFLSLFEVLEMIVRLVLIKCRTFKHRLQNQPRTDMINVQF